MTSFVPPTELPTLSEEERNVIAQFTALYWKRWDAARCRGGEGTISAGWLGHVAQKCPLDMWVYQEILVETTPDLIIECGTCLGGSTLFLASICELLGRGRVISIDIADQAGRPEHARIQYVKGNSAGPDVVAKIKRTIGPNERVMVILDSDHSCAHVLAELAAWADVVTSGCYLIVEDSLVNGHPVAHDFGPGPMEALASFLQSRSDFVVDAARERFLLTLNPSGFLRRL
jgi:cephalosporin hydroxylase